MSIAGLHGVGMRRFTLTPCPAPHVGEGRPAPRVGPSPGGRVGMCHASMLAQHIILPPPLGGRAGVRGHCATGAAGRSNPLIPCPAPARGSGATDAAWGSVPLRGRQ
jgi:hypothetical protein